MAIWTKNHSIKPAATDFPSNSCIIWHTLTFSPCFPVLRMVSLTATLPLRPFVMRLQLLGFFPLVLKDVTFGFYSSHEYSFIGPRLLCSACLVSSDFFTATLNRMSKCWKCGIGYLGKNCHIKIWWLFFHINWRIYLDWQSLMEEHVFLVNLLKLFTILWIVFSLFFLIFICCLLIMNWSNTFNKL